MAVSIMLCVSGLDFDYHDTPLLRAIDFSVYAGEVLHVQGANGRGKTTLMKLLAGLFIPQAGRITWQGRDIQEDMQGYQRALCWAGHSPSVHPALTVWEHGLFEYDAPGDDAALSLILSELDLLSLRSLRVGHLSQGQQKRLGLLRFLMREKALWLLDETFSHLDAQATTLLCRLMRQHVDRGGMVLVTAHHELPTWGGAVREYRV